MNIFTSKIFLIISFVLILISIPVTLFLLKQQQQVKTKAEATTVLTIDPPAKTVTLDTEKFSVDVKVLPNKNDVTTIAFSVQFDPAKLELLTATPSTGLSVFKGPTISSNSLLLWLATDASINHNITTDTVIATLTFKPKAVTSEPTKITFDDKSVEVYSGAQTDQLKENVFSTSQPGAITIIATSSTTPTPTPTTISTTNAPNQLPVCTALKVDRATTGTTPFSITFTANGTDADGTIQKVTFDYGDGPTQDINSNSGIGTNKVNVQISHTYNNPGTYTATATMTDNNGGVSAVGTCTQILTVGKADSSSSNPVVIPIATPTPLPIVIPTPTPIQIAQPTIAPTGDNTTTLGIIGGAILTISIGILLFAL